MAKQTVAVLFGGRSSEHSVSTVTAQGVLREIDRDRFNVIPVGITRDGIFVLEQDDADKYAFDADAMPEVVDNGKRIIWPMPGEPRELRVRTHDGVQSIGPVDVVLPLIHGIQGEDGTLQGFFETLEIPYAGAGVIDSAICLDKHFTKMALSSAGLAVAPGITVTAADWAADPAGVRAAIEPLGLPVFVKPAKAGSSVGVSKVDNLSELETAFETGFAEDEKVLVESAVIGREIEVAVLKASDGVRVSLPGEIVLDPGHYYGFEEKYMGGEGAEVVCPADLDDETIARVQEIGREAFAAVGGQGLARVDVFVTDAGEIVINELNTMPGFTPISMYPKCWVASGLSYRGLLSELVDVGLTR